jgi:predicted O-methyltransferase YrrM
MPSLTELMNANRLTDKNTVHSYLGLYESILSPIQDTAKNVIEIGIYSGGSIKLWKDYFINARVYGVDIYNMNEIEVRSTEEVFNEIKTDSRIVLYTSTDGYNEAVFKNLFLDKNIKFDLLLDDGPHTLDSMKKFIRLYSQLMTDNGILIIEDIGSIDWIEHLKAEVPENLKEYVNFYDLRGNKNRYDDIVFVINKNITK